MKRKCVVLLLTAMLAVTFSAPVFADETAEKWLFESRSLPYEVHGSWDEAVRAYTDGGSKDKMACSTTRKVKTTYSGELKLSVSKLESYALLKHSVNKTFSTKVKYSTSLKGRKKGTWVIEYRPVYKCRNVVQRKYIKVDKQWQKTGVTKDLKTKDFKSIGYRVRRISSGNLT